MTKRKYPIAGKCYKIRDDDVFNSTIYICVNKVLKRTEDWSLVECDVIICRKNELEYSEGEDWQIYSDELDNEFEPLCRQIPKKVYNEFLRRYNIQKKWEEEKIDY